MLGVAAVHWRYGELAGKSASKFSLTEGGGCRAETRSKESSTVKT